MAMDYLAIPATSVSSERVFSTGRDLLGMNRQSLCSETMEASVFILCSSWLRSKTIVLDSFTTDYNDLLESMNGEENSGLI